jgi:hypothetical protein
MRRSAGRIPETRLHFEALEARVLLDGDSGAGILTLAGSIDAPGEQDHYQFSVDEPIRVVLDSLSNRSDLTWRLDGPGGLVARRSFSATESPNTAPPAYDLAPGSYRLSVDGTQDALGAYALRVIDAASASAMAPDTPVSGVLEVGNQSALYRFRASAGDSYFFKAAAPASGALSARLLDPFGRQEGNSFDARQDRQRFTVERSGEYLLLLEGDIANQAALAYGFTLQQVVDSHSPLRLGETQIATIDQPGKIAHFTFDLAATTPVVFDRLGNAAFAWSLSGPAGQHVARRAAAQGTLFDGVEKLLLPPGSYTLSVDLDGAASGSFAFRLLAAESARNLVTGATSTGELDRATASQLYRVALGAGDKLFLEPRSLSGGSLDWRLIDPWGVRVASGDFSGATNPVALARPFTVATSGDYWLLVDGADSNAAEAVLAYEFSLNAVPDLARTPTLGDAVAGSVASAGQSTVYTFDLASPTQVAFEALSQRPDIVWSLAGPRGSEVSERRFDNVDHGEGPSQASQASPTSQASHLGILTLPAGTHRLTVRGTGAATGDFSFRLLDLATAPTLSLEAATDGVLRAANRTQAYRFLASAGDQVALEAINGSSSEEVAWRLIDRFGRDVAAPAALAAAGNASDARLLSSAGAYTLLLERRADAPTPRDYHFRLQRVGHLAPAASPAGEELALGTMLAGLLPTADASRTYRFTLAADSQLVFDTQGGASSAVWSLQGPRGNEVDSRPLYRSDDANANPLLDLPAGDYALTVKGAAATGSVFADGAYAFRLLDSAAFPELELGQRVVTMRPSAASSIGYRVAATAGSTLVLQAVDSAGGVWRLFDPFGRQVAAASGETITRSIDIASTGSYTLLNDGYYGANGASNVGFTLARQTKVSAALAFNRPLSVSTAGVGSVAEYRFTLAQASTLVFDALSGPSSASSASSASSPIDSPGPSSPRWMLAGPLGTVRGWTSLRDDPGQILRLSPGDYLLTLDTSGPPGAEYRFRVLNADSAIDLPSGAHINETIAAGETRLYRFTAAAGQSTVVAKPPLSSDVNQRVAWRLWDPYGRPLATLGAGTTQTPLPTSGEYLLAVFPTFGQQPPDSAPRPIAFSFALTTARAAPLTLNERTLGSIERPGEAVSYGFTLTAPSSLLIDTGQTDGAAAGDFLWRLSGPRGVETPLVDSRVETPLVNAAGEEPLNSFASTHASVLALPAGNYEFVVSSPALATGGFSFRLLDTATLPLLARESFIPLILGPTGEAQALSLLVDEESEFVFAPTATPTRDGDWRVLDRGGRTMVGGRMAESHDSFTLPAGAYTFVVDGQEMNNGNASDGDGPDGQDDYEFVLRRLLVRSQELPLGSEVSATIDQPGLVREYLFSIDSPTTLLVDALTDSENLTWQLSGPTGLIHRSHGFGGNTLVAPIRLDAAGAYRLRFVPAFGATENFRFRLIDAGRAESLALSGAQTLLLDPQVATLSVGSEASGSTRIANLAEQWRVSLDWPTRLLFDGLAGSRNHWTLHAADGALLASGVCDRNAFLALDAGAYTLAVKADTAADLGAYAFRLIDLASAETLSPNQEVRATLDAGSGAQIFRVPPANAGRPLTVEVASASNASGVLTAYDANGIVLGEFALPRLDPAELGTASDSERFLILENDPLAVTPLDYLLSARQATLLRAQPGETVAGDLTRAGERIGYRVSLPLAASLPTRAWIHDAGSRDVRWCLAAAGTDAGPADWWPESDASEAVDNELLAAGDYELIIEATADDARYNLQLLASELAEALSPMGTAGQLANAGEARVYRYDVLTAGDHRLHITTANAAPVAWAIYDSSGRRVQTGDTLPFAGRNAIVDLGDLEVGRFLVTLSGSAAGSPAASATGSIDFSLALSPTGVRPGDRLAGRLAGDETIRRYTLQVPVATHVQIHDQGSEAGVEWRIRDAEDPPAADGWFALGPAQAGTDDREARSPYLVWLDAGSYELAVQANGGGAFSVHLVDFDAAPPLAMGEALASFAVGEQARVYRLDTSFPGAGTRLNIGDASGEQTEEISWLLFDAQLTPVAQGNGVGTSIDLPGNRGSYTLELKRQPALAGNGTLSTPLSVVSSAPPTLQVDEVRAASLGPLRHYTADYVFSLTGRSRILVEALSEVWNVGYEILAADGEHLASDYLGSLYSDQLDLAPGDYTLKLSASGRPGDGSAGSDFTPDFTTDFNFRLLNMTRIGQRILAPGQPIDDTVAPGGQQTQVYRLQAHAGETVTIAASGANEFDRQRLYDASIVVFDPFGRHVADAWVSDGALQQTLDESGFYTLVVFGGSSLAEAADYTLVATRHAGDAQTLPASRPVALAVEISDTLTATGAAGKAYRFTLDQAGLALIEGRTTDAEEAWQAHWVLRDAAGFLTGDHGDWKAWQASSEALSLAAGDYTLEVSRDDGPGGSFAFRVDGSANASQVAGGSAVGDVSRFGASGERIYRVDLTAGDEYRLQAENGSEWSLHRPDFSQALALSDDAVLRLLPAQDGSWYLVRRADVTGHSNVTVERQLAPIALGSRISGELTANGTGDAQYGYRFRLAERKQLFLDLLSADSPLRVLFYQGNTLLRTLNGLTPGFPLDPFELAAGDYRIEVQAMAAAAGATTAYALRLLDLAAAPVLAVNTAVSGRLQGGEAAIYAVDLAAGTQVEYQPSDLGGLYGRWRLLASSGAQVATGYLDEATTTGVLAGSGRYFLVWDSDPRSAAGGQANYRFALKTAQAIALGERVGGEAFAASASAAYRFSVPTATRVLLDPALADNDSRAFGWRISRAGQSIAQGTLSSEANPDDPLPIVELPAGSYQLAFTADADVEDADTFAFRLLDLAQAQPLSMGVRNTGERLPGQAAIFSFVADAGEPLTLAQDSGDSDRWWLLDEFGRELARGQGAGSVDPLPPQRHLLPAPRR